MPVLQSDIDALTEALATGERMVRKGDKTVEYRSVDELLAARNALQAQFDGEQAARNCAEILNGAGRGNYLPERLHA